ncbi:Ribosomal silencing factor RsfS [bioreactor metagenome]|uniref:Ribosomal silencing factor RsfS n=1 Tax=bioreactor metagenome TaxID=1076179 RepID=A0A645CZG8_9ZZZZ
MQGADLARKTAQLLYDRKARDILALKVDHLMVITDYLVLATGSSALQTHALMDHLDQELSALGVQPRRIEGQQAARWIVMDYGTVIVHIFHPEDREFYRLERLWSDGSNRLVLPFEEEGKDDQA